MTQEGGTGFLPFLNTMMRFSLSHFLRYFYLPTFPFDHDLITSYLDQPINMH